MTNTEITVIFHHDNGTASSASADDEASARMMADDAIEHDHAWKVTLADSDTGATIATITRGVDRRIMGWN